MRSSHQTARSDEPAIIEHKNTRVPTGTCPNPLQRIAVDFGAGELPVALRQCDPQAETLVVIEGLSNSFSIAVTRSNVS